jgi:signal transduction histidine kinase
MPLAERPSSRALAGEVVAPIDLAVRRPDGALYPVAVSAAPLRGGGEHARGAVVVFEETTRLAEALRRRAEWIAMIAHDLRQPLMVIELALRLLARKRPPTTPEEERLLQRTQSATESINRLVGDLLDVARIESGQLRVVRRPTDVGALAREVADRVGGVEHAAIEVETRGRTGEVAVDPERVAQLLGNLLSNAVKYGDPGAPVRVGVEVSDDATELWVENTGEPIPEAERAEIFTRFYRASNAGTRRGTGLGLTICKAIAEAHGGGVHVESPGPRTTRFRARLGPA